ncbi:MAG: ATP-binding protein [Slackia sp.]|nr:ATP-binding protein [Slackia sp.]
MPETIRDVVDRLRGVGAGDAFHEIHTGSHAIDRGAWESVSAFANARGGMLVFGLDADNGFIPSDGFSIDEAASRFTAGMTDGGPTSVLVNPPQYDIRRVEFDGAPVLVVEIRELDARLKPCFLAEAGLQNGSYKRVGAENVKLTAAEIDELKSAVLPNDAEAETVADADMDDLDMAIIGSMVERRRRKSPRALRGAPTQSAQLERLNIVDKKGDVRLMGLLAAGFYPQQFFPRLVIDVRVHDGVSLRPVDHIVCDGSLSEMIDDALAALSRVLGRRSSSDGHRHADDWEIPRKALREAIANAVVHREYGRYFLGWPVSVDVYPEKVVVSSPGGLWGGKTVDAMADGTSRCRNARLMQLMESTSLASDGAAVAEGCGSGVAAMFDEMDMHALAHPEFDASPDLFQVTFARPVSSRARASARALPYRQDALFADAAEGKSRRKPAASSSGDRAGADFAADASIPIEGSAHDAVHGEDARLFERHGRHADRTRDAASHSADAADALSGHGAMQPSSFEGDAVEGSIEERIVALLEAAGEPLGARDIVDGLGLEMPVFRYRVKKLVDAGVVAATAPPTSKKRKYVLARREADE